MALKVYKPITAGTRGRIDLRRDEITADRPEKSLTHGKKGNGGRGAGGRISVRHQGGGHKRRFRDIDFKRDKHGIPGTVKTIEYERLTDYTKKASPSCTEMLPFMFYM